MTYKRTIVTMIKLFSIPVTGLENNFDSRLPFGQATLNFCLPRQLLLAKIYYVVSGPLAWALSIRQVNRKGYSPDRKIYLSPVLIFKPKLFSFVFSV